MRKPRTAEVRLKAKVDQSGTVRPLSGPGGCVAGLFHASDLPSSRGLDPAHGRKDAPPGDLRSQAARRDPRAGEPRVLGPPQARVCCLRDQPVDLL
jgi:hypothetical protein